VLTEGHIKKFGVNEEPTGEKKNIKPPTQRPTRKDMDLPHWTVCYNIVSLESNKWVGTGWEFFDDEDQASACYQRHKEAGNVPIKRPYHSDDFEHLGVVHHLCVKPERRDIVGVVT